VPLWLGRTSLEGLETTEFGGAISDDEDDGDDGDDDGENDGLEGGLSSLSLGLSDGL